MPYHTGKGSHSKGMKKKKKNKRNNPKKHSYEVLRKLPSTLAF